MSLSERPFDLVLVGATGFTGRLAAHTLLRRAPAGLRWALAGRDRGRLEAVRAELGPGAAEVELRVADGTDDAAVDALVAQTRGVLTTAGPFARYGGPLLGACARQGVDYCDITGETPWVRQMIDAHHAEAQASGARVVPFCGFDSVPSDLGVLLLALHLRRQHGQGLARARGGFLARGGVNGGTLASALHMAETGGLRAAADPYLLNPPDTVPPGAAPRDQTDAHFDEELGAWTAPFFMEAVNSRVVRRSAALYAQQGQPYGEARYSECLRLGGPAPGLVAVGLALAQGVGRWGLGVPALRGLAGRYAPAPGTGPAEAQRSGGFTKLRMLGVGDQGARVLLSLSYAGDPGNAFTVASLVECALALRLDRDRLPALGGGVLTPATGLGEVLAERLRSVGVELTLEDQPRT